MIPGEGVERTKLGPPRTELRGCVSHESTDVSARERYAEDVQVDNTWDGILQELKVRSIIARPFECVSS